MLDEAVQRAERVIAEKNPELPEAERKDVAEVVGIGAVKYADLSNDRVKDYMFDWDRMLALEGNTAPYLLYSYARIQSIFRKGRREPGGGGGVRDRRGRAWRAAARAELTQFDAVVASVGDVLEPHRLCTYLFELATLYHRFYESCPVLKAEDDAAKQSRLALCALVRKRCGSGWICSGSPWSSGCDDRRRAQRVGDRGRPAGGGAVLSGAAQGRHRGVRRAGRFRLEHERFALFPAWEHEKLEWIKPGWLDGFRDTPVESEPSAITLRAWAEVSTAWTVPSRAAFDRLDDLHPWTREQIDIRFNYKPERPLWLLALRVHRLAEPKVIPNRDTFAGCRSWVPLDGGDGFEAATAEPAMDDAHFESVKRRVEDAFGV